MNASTLNHYIIRQIAKPMIVTIVVALLALLAERTLRVVDLVVGWQGSLFVILEMIGYLIPHYLGLALPTAFFLGILIVFGRLSREGEVDAMMAAGAGLPRLVRPLVVTALFLCVIELLLLSHMQPYSRYAYRAASHVVTSASFHRLLKEGVFTSLGQSTYMVEGLSDDRTGLTHVFLFSRGDDGATVTVTAESGTVDLPSSNQPLVLHLENGVNQLIPGQKTKDSEQSGKSPTALTLRFGEFESDLSGAEPRKFRQRGEHERELTIPELIGSDNDSLPEGVKPREISAELHGRLVHVTSILILPFLALPLAIARRRGQRSYGLVLGLAMLIGYNQVVQFGESLVDNGDVNAFVGVWLPCLAFAGLSGRIFYKAAFRIPDTKDSKFDLFLYQIQNPVRRWLDSREART